jgi:hypothetical protein
LTFQSCDRLSGWLIYFMIVFSPWAFGTTQSWSIRTMNATGYLLGVLLLIKLLIRTLHGYRSPLWDSGATETNSRGAAAGRTAVAGLAFFTVAILAYCLDRRAQRPLYLRAMQMEFIYRAHPVVATQLRSARTIQCFIPALACFFGA